MHEKSEGYGRKDRPCGFVTHKYKHGSEVVKTGCHESTLRVGGDVNDIVARYVIVLADTRVRYRMRNAFRVRRIGDWPCLARLGHVDSTPVVGVSP